MADTDGSIPMDTRDDTTNHSNQQTSNIATLSNSHDAKERARALFELYVKQFTVGCQTKNCPTLDCASNPEFSSLTPQQAAARAIQTINQQKESKLCPNFTRQNSITAAAPSPAIAQTQNVPTTQINKSSNQSLTPAVSSSSAIQTATQSQPSTSHQSTESQPHIPPPARVVRSVQYNDFLSLMNACKQQANSSTPSPSLSSQGNPFAPVIRLVGEIFADVESLQESFSEFDSHGKLIIPNHEDPSIDWIGLDSTFSLLTSNESINAALQSAIRRLITPLATRALTNYPISHLRVLFLLMFNPGNNDVETYDTFKLLCKCLSSIKDNDRKILIDWYSGFSNDKLIEQLNLLQQYITVRWFMMSRIEDVFFAVSVMKLIYEANQIHQQRGFTPLITYQAFYNEAVNENGDFKDDYKRWRGIGRYANIPSSQSMSFAQNSFILDAGSKARLLQIDANVQMQQHANNAMFQSLFTRTSPYLVLRVHRHSLVSDTLAQIQHLQPLDYRKPLKIQFIGEQGIDEGGVKKEFFQLIVQELFNPDYAMFTNNEETHYHEFNSQSFESQREFELIGVILGLALYNSVILDLHFPFYYYKKLLNYPYDKNDLKEIRPELYKGFQTLLALKQSNNDSSVDDISTIYDRNFTIDIEIFGEKKIIELKPNGSNILLTRDNREEYVELYTNYILNDSIKTQFSSFKTGFDNCVNKEILNLFNSEEFQLAVIGSEELNFEALESTTRYEGYDKNSEVVKNFWSLVHHFDKKMKKKLLAFCTGSDRIPIRGLGALRLTIAKNGDDSPLLPTSSTCFNVLLLPEYQTKEKLDHCLRLALENAIGFGLI